MLALKSDKSNTYTIEQTNHEIDEVFGIENYSGTTLPNSYTDILRLHKPIMVNDEMLYFLEENANGYIYFKLSNTDDNVIYKLYRIDKSSRIIYEWLTKEKGGGLEDLTEEQLAAVNSGITSSKVTQIATNTTAISNKQNLITSTNRLSADLVNDLTTTNKFVTSNEKTTWNNKQDSLTTNQLSAVNSGITSSKVTQIDTNTNNISKNSAALVTVINNGQKNYATINSTTFTVPASGERFVRIPVINISENVVLYIGSLTSTATGTQCAVRLGFTDGTTRNVNVDRGTDISAEIILEKEISEIGIYTGTGYTASAVGTSLEITNLMLCPKSLWDISNQYVPYRPSYDELVARIEALENA